MKQIQIFIYIFPLVLSTDIALASISQVKIAQASSLFKEDKFFVFGTPKDLDKLDQVELDRLNRAIKGNPQDAVAYNNRAILKNEKLDDPIGALADYNKSIELDPNNAIVYANRAILSHVRQSGSTSFILEDYNAAIKLNPNDAISYELRAILKHSYREIYNNGEFGFFRDFSGALTDYNKAIELNPNDADLYNSRGNLRHFYAGARNLSGALSDYNKAISLDPNNKVSYKYRNLLKENKITYGKMATDYRKSSHSFFLENSGQTKAKARKMNYK
jgi:tetratricopeptide (TPR) repeat protein